MSYTAEEYREVLRAIPNMDGYERKNAFGVSTIVGSYVKDFSASDLIEKYRAYTVPNPGEYWVCEGALGATIVVIRYIKNDNVYFYYCDSGDADYYSIKFFKDNFIKIGYTSVCFKDFLDEMEGIKVSWMKKRNT